MLGGACVLAWASLPIRAPHGGSRALALEANHAPSHLAKGKEWKKSETLSPAPIRPYCQHPLGLSSIRPGITNGKWVIKQDGAESTHIIYREDRAWVLWVILMVNLATVFVSRAMWEMLTNPPR